MNVPESNVLDVAPATQYNASRLIEDFTACSEKRKKRKKEKKREKKGEEEVQFLRRKGISTGLLT